MTLHHDEEEYHQAMLEREYRIEQAVFNAEMGVATDEDFDVIRFECGISKKQSPASLVLADVFADFGNIFGARK
jgi:hypothetical protein